MYATILAEACAKYGLNPHDLPATTFERRTLVKNEFMRTVENRVAYNTSTSTHARNIDDYSQWDRTMAKAKRYINNRLHPVEVWKP